MIAAPLRILAVAGVCIAALIGLVAREGVARASGAEALMAMEAVDPRALLQGHYVTVSLQETLPARAPCPPGTESGALNTGWLALTPNGPRHSVASVSGSKEEAQRVSPLVAKGAAYCGAPFVSEGEAPAPAVLRTQLGVERFYIDQAKAERIGRIMSEQKAGQDARVLAILSIGKDGRARIKGLSVDGERFVLSWF
jgi:GDYXXLXY protein